MCLSWLHQLVFVVYQGFLLPSKLHVTDYHSASPSPVFSAALHHSFSALQWSFVFLSSNYGLPLCIVGH
ncbi:hypothetical protein GOODEAATRI_032655 [Goodea atripinnis]|uniref:Secreted protein n=1 Tax=Goodea atripinnis TaxID=208336 RepID=A0ABV0NZI5_9TELE